MRERLEPGDPQPPALSAEETAWRLAAVVESAGDAIIGKDLAGIVGSWNKAAERLFGYTAAEMIGTPILRLIPADRQQEEERILARVGAGGTVGQFETVRIHKSGQRIDVSLTVAAIRDASGRIVGASKTARDITGERRTRLALAASEMRYRRLFEAAQDGVLILDAQTGTVVDVNPFFLGLVGFAHHEVVGRAIWDLGLFDDVAASAERFAELKAEGYVRYEDLPLATRTGGLVAVEFISNLYEVDGGQVIQCNVRDVTARRAAERRIGELNADLERRVALRTAELEAANRHLEAYSTAVANDLRVAEAADRLKSNFLATMSHELRTPLNSILGFTGIVLQGLAGPLTAEQAKQLGMVRGSARHLLSLINDVLDLSKIEAGQLEIHAQPFDLNASVEVVLASMRPLATGKGLELLAVSAPLPAPLVSDRRRVEQILLNLLSNAIKFTDHGSVTLTVDVVGDEWATGPPGRVLRLRVADTGIGITPAGLATLFQPFRQLDSGLARQNEGTGLGLAICRRLATLLGGEMSAASEASQGSVFALTLPLPLAAA
jgi:PAS domain S-box-containing protein